MEKELKKMEMFYFSFFLYYLVGVSLLGWSQDGVGTWPGYFENQTLVLYPNNKKKTVPNKTQLKCHLNIPIWNNFINIFFLFCLQVQVNSYWMCVWAILILIFQLLFIARCVGVCMCGTYLLFIIFSQKKTINLLSFIDDSGRPGSGADPGCFKGGTIWNLFQKNYPSLE